MKAFIFSALLYCAIFLTGCCTSIAAQSAQKDKARIEKIIDQLTTEEKISLIAGSSSHMGTNPLPDKGIPALRFADGPLGVHSQGYKATAYPALISLAAGFNKNLAHQMGKSLGYDYRIRGVHVALAPGVNMYRMPLCGRNFEYMGEDPYAVSQLAVEYIKGMQSENVAATVKHLTGNFQEYDRHGVSTDVDERTLREIYLSAFESAVKDADVACVMTAYGLINGEHASENKFLLNDVLKKEWGFDGVVMSDWTSTYSSINAANHGLDLEMPTGKFFNTEKLLPAIENGTIPIEVIDDKVRRLLGLMARFNWLNNPETPVQQPFDNLASEQTALKVAREGIVLLKNEGILPIQQKKVNKIAVIGYQAGNPVYTGYGSAKAYPDTVVTLVDAIKEQAGKDIEVNYYAGVHPWRFNQSFKKSEFITPNGSRGLKVELFNNNECIGTPGIVRTDDRLSYFWKDGATPASEITEELFSVRWTGSIVPDKDGEHVFYTKCSDGGYRFFVNGELMVDTWDSEVAKPTSTFLELKKNVPVQIKVEYRKARHWAGMHLGWEAASSSNINYNDALQAAEEADLVIFTGGFSDAVEGEGFDRDFAMPKPMQKLLQEVTKRNENTVVALYAGGGVEMASWIGDVKAVLHLWYPGMNGTIAAAEILFGKTNPSGKLPITIDKVLSDNAAYDCYFDPKTERRVQMCEGVFGGYKHYDRIDKEPLFYLGHGFSYTNFKYSNISISTDELTADGKITVRADITNAGSMKGAETAFLFISDTESSQPRPLKELKGFDKVELAPGETKSVSFKIDKSSIRLFNSFAGKWVYEPGQYKVIIAASADKNDPNRLSATFRF